MSAAARAALVACAVLVASACEREPTGSPNPTPTPTPTASPTPTPTPTESPTRTPSAMPIPLRVVQVGGERPAPVAADDLLEPGRGVIVSTHGLALEFDRGARIDVDPGARLVRSEASSTGIALGRGSVHAVLLPEGGSARPPLRIATPDAIIEIGGSGEFFVAALPDGSAFAAALSGLGEASTGALDERGGLASVRLGPGSSFVTGSRDEADREGVSSLDEARAAAARLSRARRDVRRTAERRQAIITEEVSARIGVFEAESARGSALRARHREAVAQNRPDVLELQGEIVAHAQALLRARRAVQASFERAEAIALLSDDGAEWLRALRARAATALRLGSHGATDSARPGDEGR